MNLFFLKKIYCYLCFFGCIYQSYSQSKITGTVTDESYQPIVGVTVSVVEKKGVGTLTDVAGNFSLTLPEGSFTLSFDYLGYRSLTYTVEVALTSKENIAIVLKRDEELLEDVTVIGKSEANRIKEQALTVNVIETEGLKNSSVDINMLLNTLPGVVVRENGGLGADFSFSINGFSGNQVRFFIDGIPQDNLGSSLTFNNFPANLVERVEVYKGVVPIFLGADALGGAVNIITNQKKESFLDVAFDTGSFNTQRASINGNYFSKKGFTLAVSSFFNYSNNDYTINGNEFNQDGFTLRDSLGNETGERQPTAQRFHDAYTSGMVWLKTGWVAQKFADKLLLSAIYSANDNEIQHGITPQVPFGNVRRKEQARLISLQFQKDSLFSQNIKAKIYGEFAEVTSKIIDTSSQVFDWLGNSRMRSNTVLGETGRSKTLFQFDDSRRIVNASFQYKINFQHTINLNYTKNYLKRQGEDPLSVIPIAFEDPQVIDKNIIGLSYSLKAFENQLSATAFTKGFFVGIESVLEDVFASNPDEQFTSFESTYNNFGYGIAVSYQIHPTLQVKFSFENTFRVPEGYEFFGDGLNLLPNPTLEPEESQNVNVGVLWNYRADNTNQYQIDANLFNRNSNNRLFLFTRGVQGFYINLTDVNTIGVDGQISISLQDNLYLKANATHQYLTNTDTEERIANEPYFFGNLETGYTFKNLIRKQGDLSLKWNTLFTEAFPSQSFTSAAEDERFSIPQQWSHNLEFGYSLRNNQYNLSFQIRNITNARLYDNLNVQKPGRAFFLKLRYYLTNS
ncbi:TonB-dependent receptor [Aquimarina sp. ERC-38]|uniref:TonB-dependent receptor n=1 Tax=Aquimarina sp. ERC-38 TaxID=2949996 RepID=UPI0022476FF8|nr:TonB-dependent receptor [Aquimarina sp. ERC-38]UZO80631.1 TonB-dependent receptor [Aquimarina sp. ERC-38]